MANNQYMDVFRESNEHIQNLNDMFGIEQDRENLNT